MIVVSDTSPLNYLVLIGHAHILPALFGEVVAPPAVLMELGRAKTPEVVRTWATNLPAWLNIRAPVGTSVESGLGPGEAEAILLAQELQATTLLMDDRDGVVVARRHGLFVTGTLGVLAIAAEKELISLPVAIARLRTTTFRGPRQLIEQLLREDLERRTRESENRPT